MGKEAPCSTAVPPPSLLGTAAEARADRLDTRLLNYFYVTRTWCAPLCSPLGTHASQRRQDAGADPALMRYSRVIPLLFTFFRLRQDFSILTFLCEVKPVLLSFPRIAELITHLYPLCSLLEKLLFSFGLPQLFSKNWSFSLAVSLKSTRAHRAAPTVPGAGLPALSPGTATG